MQRHCCFGYSDPLRVGPVSFFGCSGTPCLTDGSDDATEGSAAHLLVRELKHASALIPETFKIPKKMLINIKKLRIKLRKKSGDMRALASGWSS